MTVPPVPAFVQLPSPAPAHMPIAQLLQRLREQGCVVHEVAEVTGHVLVSRDGFRAFLPTRDPGEEPSSTLPIATGRLLRYPITLRPDDDATLLVTFPDFPGATSGRTREEALARAHAFVADALAIYVALGEEIPQPARRGGLHVTVATPAGRPRSS